MVNLSCEQHDELAAGSQFVTHLTGRLLSKLNLQPCTIATRGFRALLQLVRRAGRTRTPHTRNPRGLEPHPSGCCSGLRAFGPTRIPVPLA